MKRALKGFCFVSGALAALLDCACAMAAADTPFASLPVYHSPTNATTLFCGPPTTDNKLACKDPSSNRISCATKSPGDLRTIICNGQVYELPLGTKLPPPDITKAQSSSATPNEGAHANLTATSQGSTASVKYTTAVSDTFCNNAQRSWLCGDKAERYFFSQFSLSASAPISKAADTTTLASQNGLANAAALDLEYAFYGDNWSSGHDRTFAAGVYAKPGYQQYAFITSSGSGNEAALTRDLSSANQTTSRVPVSAGVYIGTTIFGPDMLFGHYDFQNTYKDQASGTLCPANSAPGFGAITCASGSIGTPKRSETSLVSLEYKYYHIGNIPFAVDFNAIYDTRMRTRSVDVPIYFVNSGSKADLVGGIDLGWSSSNHKATIGVVIATPFNVLQPRQ
jgi:hypothetical protein